MWPSEEFYTSRGFHSIENHGESWWTKTYADNKEIVICNKDTNTIPFDPEGIHINIYDLNDDGTHTLMFNVEPDCCIKAEKVLEALINTAEYICRTS